MTQEISEALAACPWLKLDLIFDSVGRGEAVNWVIVFAICHHNLSDFKAFASQIASHIERHSTAR